MASTMTLQQRLESTSCDVRFDDLTRQLYATDASIYEIRPMAVAFPKNAREASEIIQAAADAGVPVIPRGGGTGLAGGAVGEGLVIEFSRYNRQISDFNAEAKTVRVGPGVVLDQLNTYLGRHGYWFGPDVATSSRATLGGMIANNSSGAHVPAYGTTAEHLKSLEIVLADGRVVNIGEGYDDLSEYRSAADRIVDQHAALIRERMHDGIPKRWGGYGFDRYLKQKGDLCKLVAGSEGTLAAVTSAVLNIEPLPKSKGIGVLFFPSVAEAMDASVELLDLGAAAIEHIDRILFDQTKGQLPFRAARALMELDEKPAESILIVEFFDDIDAKLADLEKRNVGMRKLICKNPAEQLLVWNVRKQGLSLLTACKGPAKPTPGIEDVCVPPQTLPEYVKGLRSILEPLSIEASYYGHAAAGELHVRPKVDLHKEEDIQKFRKIADEVADLTRRFKGSLTAEHGVGMARTEFLPGQLGPEIMEAVKDTKQLWDPENVFNPGKIIPNGKNYRIHTHLRQGADHQLSVPFEPMISFFERDESFVANLEQCNGCGGCRKDAVTMCPTFQATGEEIMSTRGRANTIRAALDNKFENNGEMLFTKELEAALEYCLSCKACKSECPSNVDIAHLKAELNNAKHKAKGVPMLDRMISNADLMGRMNTGWHAPLVNAVLRFGLTRWMMEKTLGFAADRTFPPYTTQRFDKWFAKHKRSQNGTKATRGKVILWDDSWVRYNEPNIGQAAVKVLEAAGFEVILEEKRKCCGRPACSRGVLDEAKKAGEHNVAVFNEHSGSEPIIFLEPSCYTMFIDEYRQFEIPGAEKVAERCILFEEFMYELLKREPDALPFKQNGSMSIGIHGHCHAKALTDVSIVPKLVENVPNSSARLLETGCCGMAGAFGMLKSKYELSLQVAQQLLDRINELEKGSTLIASGTSCRHQITHLTDHEPLHMAEFLAKNLETV